MATEPLKLADRIRWALDHGLSVCLSGGIARVFVAGSWMYLGSVGAAGDQEHT